MGESGYSGESGWSGYSGFIGESGNSGYSGIEGASGYSGQPGGPQGDSGFSGTSGWSGNPGTSGYSGATGTGSSGFSGRSGWSGLAGSSGFSGVAGVYTKSYSVYLDGVNDYLTTPASSGLAMSTGNFTIEMWIYRSGNSPINPANNLNLLDFRPSTPSVNINLFYLASGQKIVLAVLDQGRLTSTTMIGVSQWYHVALVRFSGVTKLYINGVQEGGSYVDSNNYLGNVCYIGGRFTPISGDYRSWFGSISNLRIVKGVAVYTSNFTPPASPLTAVAGTSLLACNTDVFSSVTPYGNTKTSMNNPFGDLSIAGPSGYSGVRGVSGFSGSVGMTPTFTTVTATTLNVQNLNFSGTGPIAVNSGNDIQLNAAGWITFETAPTLPAFTVAQLNSLVNVPSGTIAVCTDAAGGAKPVWYNGSAWKDMANGSI